MRKLVLLTFLGIAVTLPLQAVTKNESYISYDDGGTIVRTGDDAREIEARVNLPVFPGDEVITNRRGRTEVRLADGNFLAIDSATAVRLRSVLDSYDAASNETVVELRYGKAAIYRTDDASEAFRLDTDDASYFAGDEAVFSVDTDQGRDHVQVFDGAIEVRTPSRTYRVRSGEAANVDDRGMYDLVTDTRNSADSFERWFLSRTEHYGNASSRYLDSSLAYYDEDLADHGSWTFISGYGWGWRPYVNTGWRPYFYGQWVHSRTGCLTWVSYEPWGWVPYHYGRWAFDPMYGWFWMPGETYAPAWVYWWYSPGYIGWAPAGWYDCYRPYYDWAYRPYRSGFDFGFGFYGRVHVRDVDLRPWTFIDANTILSNRVDRAAISTDIVRNRLARDPGGLATISGVPARFSRNDLRNPAEAVNRIYRGTITGGGNTTVATPDMTPFFRRDPELPAAVRDRLVRTRPTEGSTPRVPVTGGAPIGGGGIAPIGGGNIAPIPRGNVAPIGGGNIAPIAPGNDNRVPRGEPGAGTTTRPADPGRDSGGHIRRGTTPPQPETPKPDSGTGQKPPESSWRGRIVRPVTGGNDPGTLSPPKPRDDWRGKTLDEKGSTPDRSDTPETRSSDRPRAIDRGSDVPRRVIDGIGGARIYRGGSRETPPPPSQRAPENKPSSPPPPPPPSNNDGGGHRDGGSGRHDSGSASRDSGSSHKDSSGSSNRESGGHVERKH